jgi:hypothetical protein
MTDHRRRFPRPGAYRDTGIVLGKCPTYRRGVFGDIVDVAAKHALEYVLILHGIATQNGTPQRHCSPAIRALRILRHNKGLRLHNEKGSEATVISCDEARRITATIAKLPDLLISPRLGVATGLQLLPKKDVVSRGNTRSRKKRLRAVRSKQCNRQC